MDAFTRERESRGQFCHTYDDIISMENLLESWREFVRDKKRQRDVTEFTAHLADNILNLRQDLAAKTYKHGGYRASKINDPKPRDIHIASVRDRLVHHAIYRVIYDHIDKHFIWDSYSCRRNKGTHRAINRFKEYARDTSCGHTRTVFVLKCDIRKFFASIDHTLLKEILERQIVDKNLLALLGTTIDSFHTKDRHNKGLPLGNLTSQLLANIYMNEFDRWVKLKLKIRHYIRYADDFVMLNTHKEFLEILIPRINAFLETRLKISLHMGKVFIKTFASGVDFLGWVHFPTHRVLRKTTKRRMFARLNEINAWSYVGLCRHGNGLKLMKEIRRRFPDLDDQNP